MPYLVYYLHNLNDFKKIISQPYRLVKQILVQSHNIRLLKMASKLGKAQQVNFIVDNVKIEEQQHQTSQKKVEIVHTMRSVIIVMDMTKSMNMKDFKPSRLSIATSMIKQFIKKAKENTPIVKFALAIGENQSLRFRSRLTYDEELLYEELDKLKVNANPGNFSMVTTLRNCLHEFDEVLTEFSREILIIQSSPLTKDFKDIFEVIPFLQVGKIRINIISMVGWTNVYRNITQAVNGEYITVNSGEQFKNTMLKFANPPKFEHDSVTRRLVDMAPCKKEVLQSEKLCFCHFTPCKTYYVCTHCDAIICKQPPLECPVCSIIVILPTDLYNHSIIN